jgi:DNA polymerase-4
MAPSIIHLDMDAFYASVEQRDDPSLLGKPVIVGGHPKRGVVLAASYEVRPFGVRSAMPMAVALRQAPHAVVVPPRMAAYEVASTEVFAILSSVTPLVEPLSLDEAFLDVTASIQLFGCPAAIASSLRQRIAKEVRLPASAGIAEVKFAAKIASDLAKPNGQKEVPAGQTRAFIAPLPVARLWGVGRKTEALLLDLGLRLVGDIAGADPDWLERQVSGGRDLWELARGIDPRSVVPTARPRASVPRIRSTMIWPAPTRSHHTCMHRRCAWADVCAGRVARLVWFSSRSSSQTSRCSRANRRCRNRPTTGKHCTVRRWPSCGRSV